MDPAQQAIPNPLRAMPATRATGIVVPTNSTPNNNCPTREGTISNANPVAASLAATKINVLTYCALVTLYLVGFIGGLIGVLLWPAVAVCRNERSQLQLDLTLGVTPLLERQTSRRHLICHLLRFSCISIGVSRQPIRTRPQPICPCHVRLTLSPSLHSVRY